MSKKSSIKYNGDTYIVKSQYDYDLYELRLNKDKEIERLNKECDTYMKIATKRGNIINELEKWFKSYHKYQNRLKWDEQDYIEFIDNLEKELKEGK